MSRLNSLASWMSGQTILHFTIKQHVSLLCLSRLCSWQAKLISISSAIIWSVLSVRTGETDTGKQVSALVVIADTSTHEILLCYAPSGVNSEDTCNFDMPPSSMAHYKMVCLIFWLLLSNFISEAYTIWYNAKSGTCISVLPCQALWHQIVHVQSVGALWVVNFTTQKV